MANRTLRTVVFDPANDRFGFANTAIVITDGQSNVDTPYTLTEAQELQKFVDVFVVGVTNEINMDELRVGRTNVFDGSQPRSSSEKPSSIIDH